MTRLHADARNRSEAIKVTVQTNTCVLAPFARNSQGKNAGDRPLGSSGRPYITTPPRLERALTAGRAACRAAAAIPVVVVKGP